MEGLIPLVYRTVKRSTTRRRYKSIPSGVELQNYNISDFYPEGYNYRYAMTSPQLPEKRDQAFGFGGGGGGGGATSAVEGGIRPHRHRRHMSSIGDYNSSGFSGAEATPENLVKPKKLVRFRSHRFFSCVTGTP